MPSVARPTPSSFVGTEPGAVVGGYELLREIGRGGMAEVWIARKAKSTTGKFIAIKLVLPRYVGDERYSGMFRTEAEVSAPLSHGNIVQVFDEGEDHGRSYLVMEWVDGVDLARLVTDMAQLQQRDPYLRLRVAAYIIGQVLHGLSYAHKVISHRGAQIGIVHRDISPQNILVSVSGDVKIADFGIAHRMTEETSGINVKGKLRYMAPEHLGGKSHAPTVDLYAVGAMLHELLDGEKFRHDAADQLELYRQVIGGIVPTLRVSDVPPELDAVRLALLAPDPRRRPQTADAALLMLKRWAGYSEMKVELSMICGLATGVVRPRTGPLIEAGQPTIPPPRGGAPMFVAPMNAEPDAPRAPWGTPPSMVPTIGGHDLAAADAGTAMLDPSELPFAPRPRSEPTAMLHERQDLEPTHSAVQWNGTAIPLHERSIVRVDVGRSRTRAWVLVAGFGLLAAIGAGATAWTLIDEPLVVARNTFAPIDVDTPIEPAPEIAIAAPGPTLTAVVPVLAEPASVIPLPPAPESVALPVVEPEPALPVEPIAKRRATTRKPRASTKPIADEATGPEVIVRFRLADGLTEADVKLGARVIAVRPHYDTRVPSGRYAAKWRTNATDTWKAAGTIVIGDSGEWKFFIGPKGARVSKL